MRTGEKIVEFYTYKLRDRLYQLLKDLTDTISETGSDYDIVVLPRIEEIDQPGTMFLIEIRRYLPVEEDIAVPVTLITIIAFSDGSGRIRIYVPEDEKLRRELEQIAERMLTLLEAEKIED